MPRPLALTNITVNIPVRTNHKKKTCPSSLGTVYFPKCIKKEKLKSLSTSPKPYIRATAVDVFIQPALAV